MKHYIAPLLLFGLWSVVLTLFLIPEAPNGHGIAHSRIQEMDQGGSGLARHGDILMLGWAFGSLLIAIFVSLLAWGTLAGQSDSPRRFGISARGWAFLLGGLFFEGVFLMMCWAYAGALDEPRSEVFRGPFPRATSWMLFGIWPAPAVFVALYVVCFDRWILPPHHITKFKKLVDETRPLN